jgi:S-adenosylhomocysteine hydrolase
VCGCELDADQTYCLECGTATPLAPRLRRGVGGLAAVAAGLIVLGAGSGGLAAAKRAASYGARVAIVEGDRVHAALARAVADGSAPCSALQSLL